MSSASIASISGRETPHNIEAEQGLLGAILVNNRVMESVGEYLAPEHFVDGLHGRIYGACLSLFNKGETANPITLKAMFDQDEALQASGGAQYLVKLSASVVTVINAGDYGKAIYDSFRRRELIELGSEIVNEAYHHDIDITASDLIEDAESKLYSIAESGAKGGGLASSETYASAALARINAAAQNEGGLIGLSTGLRALDNWTGGLVSPDLNILAARPSMGKTSLARKIALHVAENNGPVAFFSLEMSDEQQGISYIAALSGVSVNDLLAGNVGGNTREVHAAKARLERAPLFIDQRGGLKASQVRSAARRLKRRHGLSMIVVDYLQLMAPEKASGNRVQDLSQITASLKALAKELGVPVLALSQLSRSVEQRDDKRPVLSDLRESGSIEQDADQVWFLYRDEYYIERRKPDEKYINKMADWRADMDGARGRADVDVAKRRMGPIGRAELRFIGKTTTFEDIA